METNPLASIVRDRRPPKPRTTGITMMADWGIGAAAQRDLVETSGAYIDLAKVAVGISALLPVPVLREKLACYAAADIRTFTGGQFLEYALLDDRADDYMRACAEAGFGMIEVSDNLLEIDLGAKCALIRRAREEFGLGVLGEAGKKEGIDSDRDLAEDAERCLEAGAEKVFLEAADLFSGEVAEDEVERIASRCGAEALIFELPGPWIKGVTLSEVHETTRWMLRRFGPEVNIANVSPPDVIKLEALRLRIGVNAGGEEY